MIVADIPHIASSTYTNSAYGLGTADNVLWDTTITAIPPHQVVGGNLVARGGKVVWQEKVKVEEEVMADNKSRLVRVIIVDPNDNLPLEERLVYGGEEKFTDLNDQELFFELEIKQLLAAHNEKRIKTVDKTVKEHTEYLEAAKIRDLKMVVVNIATF